VLWPRFRNHKLVALAACALAGAAYAQTVVPPAGVEGGQGDIAVQGYYMGGNQQTMLNTTGTSFRFSQFLPNIGMLSGSLEGYASQNRFQTGENFLELKGLPWGGHYWTFTGGDFRAPSSLVEFPFNNIFTPEIDARGVEVQAMHGATQYTFFAGEETLSAGPRVAYRILVPQTVMGLSAVRRVAPHLLVAARWMEFSTSAQSIADNPYLFPAGRTVGLARTVTAQALYAPLENLKMYAEASVPQVSGERRLTSTLAGISWEDAMFTVKGNYVSQGIYYYPLAGYFAGDRRGPYGELRFRPRKGLELFASASQYRNNLERDPELPLLVSNNASLGLSTLLPGQVSFTGQLSTVRYTSQEAGEAAVASNNRQLNAALSRGFGRQTVQVEWREIQLDVPTMFQRQRSTEIGDTFQFRHFSVGGAGRYQQITGYETLNSLFFRGMAQANAGPVSVYANVEIGNDLANQTVFSTEAYRTSVVGVTLRLPGRWSLQTEVFRNQLNLALNEQSVFLLQTGDVLAGISPAAATLAAYSQWSLFFRLSKQIQWGGGLPAATPAAIRSGGLVRLTGSVEGMVRLKAIAGARGAASIPVSIDGSRTVLSAPDGHYVFEDVPEGVHEVGLALEQLPADYDPGTAQRSQVAVEPRRAARADFEVLPLATLAGRVTGPEHASVEDIVVRLSPGNRYTSTHKDGSFVFYNVREGDYEVMIDPRTLPDGGELQSSAPARAEARFGGSSTPVEFAFTVKTLQKPIRKVLDRQ
jgi:hypothetical protein